MVSLVLAMALAAAAPLVEAAKANDRAAALALLEKRVDVNAPEPDGTTALHWAAHNGDLELVQRLIRAGANVKAVNDFGATPMSEAAVLADSRLLGALLEAVIRKRLMNLGQNDTSLRALLDADRFQRRSGA